MVSPPFRSRATTIAAVLDLALTALFLLLSIAAIVGVSITKDLPTIEGGRSPRVLFYVLALVVIGVCVWTGTIGVKLLQLRSWARIAGIVTFGGFVVLSLSSLVDPRGREWGAGFLMTLLVTMVDIAIVVLLISPESARDFTAAQPPEVLPES
jgi:hypothetical protein